MEKTRNFAKFFMEIGVNPEYVRIFLAEAIDQAEDIALLTKDIMSQSERDQRCISLCNMKILESVARQACISQSF